MNEIKDAPWVINAELYGDPWYRPRKRRCDIQDEFQDEIDLEENDDEQVREDNRKTIRDRF
jgi:hypothetical protein